MATPSMSGILVLKIASNSKKSSSPRKILWLPRYSSLGGPDLALGVPSLSLKMSGLRKGWITSTFRRCFGEEIRSLMNPLEAIMTSTLSIIHLVAKAGASIPSIDEKASFGSFRESLTQWEREREGSWQQ